MNQHAAEINRIINEHKKNGAYWWNVANGTEDMLWLAELARNIVSVMTAGDAQRFKEFIRWEYIEYNNRGWFDEHYEQLNEEQKNNIATFIDYAKSALAQLKDLFDTEVM